jgi:mannose-1-phosphate guanylyltransferase
MKTQEARGQLWAIVLAAGEGTRLAELTRLLHGRDVPKQFARLWGAQTFLQRTLVRISGLVPASRTVVVVGEHHVALATDQLTPFPGVQIVRQPMNRGTGPGVLLPLAHVLARDPQARVLVFPSDHEVRRVDPFLDAARRAVLAAEEAHCGVALLGSVAEAPASDLGWILAGPACGPAAARAHLVDRFVEKPDEAQALALLRNGALWNTLVLAARAGALWDLAQRHVPAMVERLAPYLQSIGQPDSPRLLREIYDHLPAADLSRDILEPARGLAVVPMLDAGWSDCGTPERLVRALHDTGDLRRLPLSVDCLARTSRDGPRVAGAPAGPRPTETAKL